MSVLFRQAGKDLWLEASGGVNAFTLAGRFTAPKESIHKLRDMAAQKEW
jgi:hypothetical protein